MEFVSFVQALNEDNVLVVEEGKTITMAVKDGVALLKEDNMLIPFIYRLGEPRNITDFLIDAVEDTSEDFDVFDLIINLIFIITGDRVELCSTIDIGMEYEDENGETQRDRLAKKFADIPLANWEREFVLLMYESVK